MWLINASSREIVPFIDDGKIPRYAILSHTWGREEVKFQDLYPTSRPGVQQKIGYQKIDYCCRQAIEDGIAWAWVDT